MPPERIKALIERGRQAGEKFREFDEDRHRWTRFVSSMISFAEAQTAMQEVWNADRLNADLSLQKFVTEYLQNGIKAGQSAEWQKIAIQFAEYIVSENGPAVHVEPQPEHEVAIRIVSNGE